MLILAYKITIFYAMRSVAVKNYKLHYKKGIQALSAHDDIEALRRLRLAVDLCPVSRRRDLSDSLYWLAISLRRLGEQSLSLKALASAQKLAPRGRARTMYERLANDYGMIAASSSEQDDYKAFCAVQIQKCLALFPERRFPEKAALDKALHAIAATWLMLQKNGALRGMSPSAKLTLYQTTQLLAHEGVPLSASEFSFTYDGQCACGSGLHNTRCCGRVQSPSERMPR